MWGVAHDPLGRIAGIENRAVGGTMVTRSEEFWTRERNRRSLADSADFGSDLFRARTLALQRCFDGRERYAPDCSSAGNRSLPAFMQPTAVSSFTDPVTIRNGMLGARSRASESALIPSN
jgi:hypothetical protein